MICSERVEDAYSVNAKLLYGAAIGDKETVNLEALKKQLEMQMGTLVRLEELFADHPAAVRRIMAEMEFARCEVFYRWRPELKEAGQSVCTKEETDEKLDEVDAGVRAAIPAPNLGDNTNFHDPVNQRGQASYTGNAGKPCCIDRWHIEENATYNVAAHTLIAESYAARACGIWQVNMLAEDGLAIGDTVTVSLCADGQLHTASMPILDRSQYSDFADVPAGYSCGDFEIILCTDMAVNGSYKLCIYPKKSISLDYIKWEKGGTATPWQAPRKEEELAVCQRYFYRVDDGSWNPAFLITGWGLIAPFSLPMAMRTSPTVSMEGAQVYTPAGWVNLSLNYIQGFNSNKNTVYLTLTPAQNLDEYSGRAMMVSKIESFSAEL